MGFVHNAWNTLFTLLLMHAVLGLALYAFEYELLTHLLSWFVRPLSWFVRPWTKPLTDLLRVVHLTALLVLLVSIKAPSVLKAVQHYAPCASIAVLGSAVWWLSPCALKLAGAALLVWVGTVWYLTRHNDYIRNLLMAPGTFVVTNVAIYVFDFFGGWGLVRLSLFKYGMWVQCLLSQVDRMAETQTVTAVALFVGAPSEPPKTSLLDSMLTCVLKWVGLHDSLLWVIMTFGHHQHIDTCSQEMFSRARTDYTIETGVLLWLCVVVLVTIAVTWFDMARHAVVTHILPFCMQWRAPKRRRRRRRNDAGCVIA